MKTIQNSRKPKGNRFDLNINRIKNIVIAIGLPGLIGYIIYVNSSKSELKNAEIELLQSQIDVLKTNQVDELIPKSKLIKEYYESELNSLKMDFQNVTRAKDSLQNILKSPILIQEGRYLFTGDQVKAIYRDYLKLKYDSLIINVLNDMIANQQVIISNQDSNLISLKKTLGLQEKQRENLEKIIDNLESTISMQKRQINRLERKQK